MKRRNLIAKALSAVLGGTAAISLKESALAACSEASCPTTRRQWCCGGRCLTCPVGTHPVCVTQPDGDTIARCCNNTTGKCETMYRV